MAQSTHSREGLECKWGFIIWWGGSTKMANDGHMKQMLLGQVSSLRGKNNKPSLISYTVARKTPNNTRV